ncbi:DUF6197 family protein [Streptomyces hydrogenans]|uniref:DUF6197 family protein n=1 Tax=Streptomyces hydrogenans TaxID=1873719 RepID=UPI00342154B0
MNHTLDIPTSATLDELTDPYTWYGPSGQRVTGEAVARHLEAAAQLMDRHNWDPQLYAPYSGHHLADALYETIQDGQGDADTRQVGRRVMETLLRHVMAAPFVDCDLWSQHSSRTLEEVLMLCRTAARIARHAGPQSSNTEPPALP